MTRISIFAPPNFGASRACPKYPHFPPGRLLHPANAKTQRLGRWNHGIAVEENSEVYRVLAWRQLIRKVDCETSIVLPVHLVEIAHFAIGTNQEITRNNEQPKGPPHGGSQ